MSIGWNSTHETGQPLMDTEHRLLVMLFHKLGEAIRTRQSDGCLLRTTIEVRKFVEFHFISEENLMRETHYPGTEAHRTIHTELLTEVNAMISKLASNRVDPEEVLEFLNRWLVDHIANQDHLVADHIRGATSRPVAESLYAEYLLPSAPVVAAAPSRPWWRIW